MIRAPAVLPIRRARLLRDNFSGGNRRGRCSAGFPPAVRSHRARASRLCARWPELAASVCGASRSRRGLHTPLPRQDRSPAPAGNRAQLPPVCRRGARLLPLQTTFAGRLQSALRRILPVPRQRALLPQARSVRSGCRENRIIGAQKRAHGGLTLDSSSSSLRQQEG